MNNRQINNIDSLPVEKIASAFAAGAEAWIAEVRAARLKRLAARPRRAASAVGAGTLDVFAFARL